MSSCAKMNYQLFASCFGGKKVMKKLLIALFKHETDSFCPEPADMRAFSVREIIRGEDIFTAFRGVRNEPGAFIDVFSDRKDIDLIPVLAMNAMPSGPVTATGAASWTSRIVWSLDAPSIVIPSGAMGMIS